MSGILTAIGSVITSVTTWVTTCLSSISNVFYDSSASTPTFTFLGTLLLVAFGLGMVWVAINFIKSLVKRG